jgi:hypothetical protein
MKKKFSARCAIAGTYFQGKKIEVSKVPQHFIEESFKVVAR